MANYLGIKSLGMLKLMNYVSDSRYVSLFASKNTVGAHLDCMTEFPRGSHPCA